MIVVCIMSIVSIDLGHKANHHFVDCILEYHCQTSVSRRFHGGKPKMITIGYADSGLIKETVCKGFELYKTMKMSYALDRVTRFPKFVFTDYSLPKISWFFE